MRFQRIFWGFLFLFPNAVLAQADAALLAEAQASLAKLTMATTKVSTSKPTVMSEAQAKVAMTGGAAAAAIPTLESTLQSTVSQGTFCTAAYKAAMLACLEQLSPEIVGFVKDNGAAVSAAGTAVSSIAGQCEGIGKLISKASIALGAFQVACAAAQATCTATCGKLEATALSLEKIAAPLSASATVLAQDTALASGLAVSSCQKNKLTIQNAISGGLAALVAMQQAKSCNEKTASTGIDCNDKNNAYYNQKNCMCTRNELPVAECQNMTIGNGSGVSAPAIALGGEGVSVSGDGTAGELYGTKPTALGANIDGSSGGGLPGAPTGGGSVGASGGGGRAQDGTPTLGRRLNTNILGGGFGGGGGGGISTGPGYGETDSSLKAYAPGGTKDANRVVASEIAKQVTNPAGRSNWEKVKNRYTDHVRSLTGR